jgi:hypothetical protein
VSNAPDGSSQTGRPAVGDALRGDQRLDLTAIPAGSTTNRVTPGKTARSNDTGTGRTESYTYELREITGTGAIVESQLTWNDRSTGVPWSTPGGDFGSTVLSSITNIADGATGTGNDLQPTLTFSDSAAFTAAANAAFLV